MPFAKLDKELIGRISNGALIVYTMMRDRATYITGTEDKTLHYKAETIAKISNVSVASCKRHLKELEACGLIETIRTGRASYYIVKSPEHCTADTRDFKLTTKV